MDVGRRYGDGGSGVSRENVAVGDGGRKERNDGGGGAAVVGSGWKVVCSV